MRFYDIALFLFIFNLLAGFFVEIGMASFSEEYPSEIEGFGTEEVQTSLNETGTAIDETQEGLFGEINFIVENVRLVVRGISILWGALINATILFPIMLTTLKFPSPLVLVLSSIVYLVYLVGIIQFLLGKSFKEAQ